MLTCASLYQLPPESGLVEEMEDELFGNSSPHAQQQHEEGAEEPHWKEGELSSPPRPHGPAAFPGWVLDTKPLTRQWARGHRDPMADKLQQAVMPDSLHVFHPCQVRTYRLLGRVGGVSPVHATHIHI